MKKLKEIIKAGLKDMGNAFPISLRPALMISFNFFIMLSFL